MKTKRISHAIVLICTLLLTLPIFAAPDAFTYQGQLNTVQDGKIAPMTNQNAELEVRIYKSPTGKNPVWGRKINVLLDNGAFNTEISDAIGSHIVGGITNKLSNVIATNALETLYIGLTPVGGSEITPRQRIMTVPYSMTAASVNVTGPFMRVKAIDSYIHEHQIKTGYDKGFPEFGHGGSPYQYDTPRYVANQDMIITGIVENHINTQPGFFRIHFFTNPNLSWADAMNNDRTVVYHVGLDDTIRTSTFVMPITKGQIFQLSRTRNEIHLMYKLHVYYFSEKEPTLSRIDSF